MNIIKKLLLATTLFASTALLNAHAIQLHNTLPKDIIVETAGGRVLMGPQENASIDINTKSFCGTVKFFNDAGIFVTYNIKNMGLYGVKHIKFEKITKHTQALIIRKKKNRTFTVTPSKLKLTNSFPCTCMVVLHHPEDSSPLDEVYQFEAGETWSIHLNGATTIDFVLLTENNSSILLELKSSDLDLAKKFEIKRFGESGAILLADGLAICSTRVTDIE